ncbi:MAG: DegT/DnrJ/EryC1/StrS family aminotransferase [Candidatus Omnitrophica bacterium]|nr:DegT/DnrJ/EryC1/StrS family aminotransferase [Candidatus Omnitrophota bacterium]
MRKEFLVFGSPLIEQEEIDEVVDCLKSGWIGTGPKVARFEQMFREYKDSRFALAVNSCTAALHLSMLAIGVGPGDEVIVPAMTFAATANAVIHTGATPVLVDCKKDTMNIDPDDIRRKITPKSKAVIPVHFAGRPCDMDAIMDIAKKHRLKVIEDCAHAIEAEYHGRKTGTIGDLGCFSFYVTKYIVTGEGGMVITGNEEYADKIKVLALHGMSKDAWKRFSDDGYKHYQVVYPGFKYNMMDIQAAIGIHQMQRIDAYWQRRRDIWSRYNEAFIDLPLVTPAPAAENTRNAYHLYPVLLDSHKMNISRDSFLEALIKRNIGVGVHYIALHMHPYYRETYGYKPNDFPNATQISGSTVSLPLSAKMNSSDLRDVIAAVTNLCSP